MSVKARKEAALKVAIVYPCGDDVKADFAFHLANLMGVCAMSLVVPNIGDVQLFMLKNTYIDAARDHLARTALEWGATHILWLDGDMIFPSDTLIRLLNRNEAIVGANYCTRRLPPMWTAMKKVNLEEDERCKTMEHSKGLEPVDSLGFGCILTRADVYEKIALGQGVAKRFFLQTPEFGEDVYFCKLAAEYGFSVMLDHDLSHEVGHIGTMLYKNEHAAEWDRKTHGDLVVATQKLVRADA